MKKSFVESVMADYVSVYFAKTVALLIQLLLMSPFLIASLLSISIPTIFLKDIEGVGEVLTIVIGTIIFTIFSDKVENDGSLSIGDDIHFIQFLFFYMSFSVTFLVIKLVVTLMEYVAKRDLDMIISKYLGLLNIGFHALVLILVLLHPFLSTERMSGYGTGLTVSVFFVIVSLLASGIFIGMFVPLLSTKHQSLEHSKPEL